MRLTTLSHSPWFRWTYLSSGWLCALALFVSQWITASAHERPSLPTQIAAASQITVLPSWQQPPLWGMSQPSVLSFRFANAPQRLSTRAQQHTQSSKAGVTSALPSAQQQAAGQPMNKQEMPTNQRSDAAPTANQMPQSQATAQARPKTEASSATALPPKPICTSSQKPGSLLVFPYYNARLASQFDTRLTLSNVGTQLSYVHVFLVDGTTGSQVDFFVCLTPNAIFSFQTSEYDPDNTGFAFAVAVDQEGLPTANNALIGNGFVDEGNYHGNYVAEAFWRYDTTTTASKEGAAILQLNGTEYDAAPTQFAVEIQSPVDVAGQRIVLAPLAGDLTAADKAVTSQTAATTQIGVGMAANEQEQTLSFDSFLRGGCLKAATISTTSPNVPGGLGALIPTGKMGVLKFRVGAGTGLLFSPRTNVNRWSGIRSLHKTAVGNATMIIPVSTPVC